LLIKGEGGRMVGIDGRTIISTSLEEVTSKVKPLDTGLYRLAEELAV
jgi:hypothetical protein